MPSGFHEIPNPPPERSQLPESLFQLAVNLDDQKKSTLTKDELNSIQAFRQAANYIAAAMIFLKENALLERPVKKTDIKPRLLGHWGTCTYQLIIFLSNVFYRPGFILGVCSL
jgi:xylulose-5-phosphate/fructose-6-phosphate phosphoketolase